MQATNNTWRTRGPWCNNTLVILAPLVFTDLKLPLFPAQLCLLGSRGPISGSNAERCSADLLRVTGPWLRVPGCAQKWAPCWANEAVWETSGHIARPLSASEPPSGPAHPHQSHRSALIFFKHQRLKPLLRVLPEGQDEAWMQLVTTCCKDSAHFHSQCHLKLSLMFSPMLLPLSKFSP